ncbi:MAG: hypothetical protein NTY17_00460, partial [Planctomycetia bacterium]|nr:hypothetical protein [Planctomycetia bacterium]
GQPYPAGEHVWQWDGLDDRDQPVPPGAYTAHVLTHDGIRQRYVCDVGTSGTPPYQTEDDTGGWAGDYNAPTFVAADGDRVVLGTGNAEAQKPAIGTDLEGRKLFGTAATGDVLVLHQGFGYFGRNGTLTKFSTANGRLEPFADGRPNAQAPVGLGLVVLDNATLLTATGTTKLFLVDLASGKEKGQMTTSAPLTGGLARDGKGTIYAVSGNAVGRLDAKGGGFTPLAADLDAPRMLACDAAGNLFVSLQGKTMQVWKLDPTGKVLQKFGVPGGRPAVGRFDRAGMLMPHAIAVDRNARLWVCESDGEPKRYSVWNPDGTLHPEKFYAQNVRYLVDYDEGTWRTDATIIRDRVEEGVVLASSPYHVGGRVVTRDGRKFLLSGGWASSVITLYEEVGDGWLPRLSYQNNNKTFWLDANNDGVVQKDEIQSGSTRLIWGGYSDSITIDDRLNLYSWSGQGFAEPTSDLGRRTYPFTIQRLDFLGFAANGGLRYADAMKTIVREPDGQGGSPIGGVVADPDGSTYLMVSGGLVGRGERPQATGARVVKYGPDGKEAWRYTNVHPGFAWTSSSFVPGFIVAAFRMPTGHHPDLVPVTGYYGQYFLLDKQTGAFVDAVGQDQRSGYVLDQTMVLTENFNGNIFKH